MDAFDYILRRFVDPLLNEMVGSTWTAVVAAFAGWLCGVSFLDGCVRRLGHAAMTVAAGFASGVTFAATGAWFGWARYRLWRSWDWSDPPQSFPYPDALLLAWCDALRVPPPPGALDLHGGLYFVDARLFAIVTLCWFAAGICLGLALPYRRLRPIAGRLAKRAKIRPSSASENVAELSGGERRL